MLDVTYIFTTFSNITNPRLDKLDSYPSTTRVMTNILNNQKELNVIYSKIPLLILLSYIEYCKTESNPDFTTFHYHFCNEIIKSIETDIVLLTLGNPWEILFAGYLLNAGKKVVAGGSYTKTYTLKELRQILYNNGARNLDNIIIIRPYINKNFNIYNAIKNWSDIDYINYDCTTIYDTDDDFYLEYYHTFKLHGVSFNRVAHMLTTTCNWNKCEFCKFGTDCSHDFIKKETMLDTINNSNSILSKYKCNVLNIMDPEFYFTKKNQMFLDMFRENSNHKISFFTSIRLLKDDRYFDMIFNKYKDVINSVVIGIETLDESALKLINKGVTVRDTFEVVDKIIKANNQSDIPIGIGNLFMSNLASFSKLHIIDGYNKAFELKEIFDSSTTPTTYSFSEFKVNPLVKYVYNNPFIKLKGEPLKVLNKYDRFDRDGNLLPLDKEIIDPEIWNKIVTIRW